MTNNVAYIQNNVIMNRPFEQGASSQQVNKPPISQRTTVRKPKPELNYPKCKALYDYNAADNDELTFRENDIIYILQEGN
jgi:hypothetical protein